MRAIRLLSAKLSSAKLLISKYFIAYLLSPHINLYLCSNSGAEGLRFRFLKFREGETREKRAWRFFTHRYTSRNDRLLPSEETGMPNGTDFFSRDRVYIPPFERFTERPSSLTRPRFTSWPVRGKLQGEDKTKRRKRALSFSSIRKKPRYSPRHVLWSGGWRKMVSQESIKHLGVKFRRVLSEPY